MASVSLTLWQTSAHLRRLRPTPRLQGAATVLAPLMFHQGALDGIVGIEAIGRETFSMPSHAAERARRRRASSSVIGTDLPGAIAPVSGLAATVFDANDRDQHLAGSRSRIMSGLVDAGILVETTGRRRIRSFSYEGYLDILRAGTEAA